MDLIGVGKCEFWLVVAKLLWGGDAQLVQSWLQFLKISSQSLLCTQTQRGNSRCFYLIYLLMLF